jgi:hypothetical protein
VPGGDGWVHELKFDGYRVQSHKMGSRVDLFSCTECFASIAELLREMPAKAAILDGEAAMPTAVRTSPGCACGGQGPALSACGRSTYSPSVERPIGRKDGFGSSTGMSAAPRTNDEPTQPPFHLLGG